jgi:hypothetical protein
MTSWAALLGFYRTEKVTDVNVARELANQLSSH